MSKPPIHSPEVKAKVTIESIGGRSRIQVIAANHVIYPIQDSLWKRQLLDGAIELFSSGKKTKDKD